MAAIFEIIVTFAETNGVNFSLLNNISIHHGFLLKWHNLIS